MFDEDWPRYVLKMATGAGKTKVLSLLLAWSYFHKLYEPDSRLARNFLVIAPNIIVLDRIYKIFRGCASSSTIPSSLTMVSTGATGATIFN
jgi:type III restriction enzyme